MTNCDIGSTPAMAGRVTKPKIFDDKAFYVRLRPGFRDRMEAQRGEMRIGDFARELLEEALEAREAQPQKKG